MRRWPVRDTGELIKLLNGQANTTAQRLMYLLKGVIIEYYRKLDGGTNSPFYGNPSIIIQQAQVGKT